MSYIHVGNYVKFARKQKGMSQDALANGILDRSNLTRFENGKQELSKEKIDKLFERLGYSTESLFSHILHDNAFKVSALRDRFTRNIVNEDDKTAQQTIFEMEQNDAFESDIHKQFLLRSKAMVALRREDSILAKPLLDEAIRITLPMFDEEKVEKYLLTTEDIEIINMLAAVHFYNNDLEKAIKLLEKLMWNIKTQLVDEKKKAHSFTLTAYNLSKYLGATGRYQESLKVCDEAIETGQLQNAYGMLPNLIYNKAYALFHLGEKDEVSHLMHQAYFGNLVLGREQTAKLVKEYASEKYSVKIVG